MARKINLIVIHCSDSPNGRTLFTGKHGDANFVTPAQEIDRWHGQRGFSRLAGWRVRQNPELAAIGYHYVVYTSGAVASGRHIDEVGAHAYGHNAGSLGICMVGRDKFTRAQWDGLRVWLCVAARTLELRAPNPPKRFNPPTPAEALAIFAQLGVRVAGHREINPGKTCPNFGVADWLARGMEPQAGSIAEFGLRSADSIPHSAIRNPQSLEDAA